MRPLRRYLRCNNHATLTKDAGSPQRKRESAGAGSIGLDARLDALPGGDVPVYLDQDRKPAHLRATGGVVSGWSVLAKRQKG